MVSKESNSLKVILQNHSVFDGIKEFPMEQIASTDPVQFTPTPIIRLSLERRSKYLIYVRFKKIDNKQMEFQQNQWTRTCLRGIANEEPILHLGTKLGKHWNNKDMHVAIQIADVFNPIRTEELETQMLYQPIVCICEVYEDPFEQEVLSQPIEFTFDCLKFIAVPFFRNPLFQTFRLDHLKASPPRFHEGKVILGHKQLYDNNGANNAVTSDYNPNKVYHMDKDMDEWVSCYKAQANDVYHPSVTFALLNDH